MRTRLRTKFESSEISYTYHDGQTDETNVAAAENLNEAWTRSARAKEDTYTGAAIVGYDEELGRMVVVEEKDRNDRRIGWGR